MMMIMDKKKTLNQILGADPREKKEEGAEESALSSCMSEFISCVKDGDVEGAVQAFRSCYAELGNESQGE